MVTPCSGRGGAVANRGVVGFCIRRFRKEKLKITQEEAAFRCNMDVRVFGEIERGKAFRSTSLFKITEGLGMTLDDFRVEE